MHDVVIVGKALDDFGDYWHWIVLESADRVQSGVYRCGRVVTRCGIELDAGPIRVTLHDTGAPPEPDCPECIDRDAATAQSVREEVTA